MNTWNEQHVMSLIGLISPDSGVERGQNGHDGTWTAVKNKPLVSASPSLWIIGGFGGAPTKMQRRPGCNAEQILCR